MTELQAATSKRASGGKAVAGRLFVLDLSDGRVLSMDSDGSDKKIIATGCRNPDGIAVDVEAGHIYWTNMGVPNLNDGSIERADIDGKNRKVVIPEGGTFTPKQLHLETKNGKLCWSDREGMRVVSRKRRCRELGTRASLGRHGPQFAVAHWRWRRRDPIFHGASHGPDDCHVQSPWKPGNNARP